VTAPLLVFVATYFLIAVQRVRWLHLNRPAAALLGAVGMVTVGGLPLADAYASVDLDVLVFLLGLMILVGHLELAGFFEAAAGWMLRVAGTPTMLLVLVVVGSGLLSALFVNDTVCLVFTPILIAALAPLELRLTPYLVGLATGSNVGSALTIVGNPQNMLIGLWSGIGFGAFTWRMLVPVSGGLAITAALLLWIYRDELARPLGPVQRPEPPPLDRRVVGIALLLFAGALGCWLAGLSLPLVAVASGALMLALAGRHPGPALARVEWELLLLFAALFVVTRGLQASGAVAALDPARASDLSLGGRWSTAGAVSGGMLVLSNLVGNVPAVLLWRDVVPELPDPEFVWQVMALASTFAGNLLLIGSMANLIVAERAEARGVRLGYWEYARAGVPVTLATLLWGVGALVLLHGGPVPERDPADQQGRAEHQGQMQPAARREGRQQKGPESQAHQRARERCSHGNGLRKTVDGSGTGSYLNRRLAAAGTPLLSQQVQ
jgi:Na+/H+ antiporter NhaD/arsenite permease-like protein